MFDISSMPLLEIGNLTLADIAPFLLIGFAAQLIDGALGMAFGVISQTLLVSIGVPPAATSACVYLGEVSPPALQARAASSSVTSTGAFSSG